MDSGFCVLKALIELVAVGVYGSAVIKKRRFWPKYVDGDGIKAHFLDKAVGDVASLPGTLDGQNFSIFCMKEEDYTMMLMSTYGALREIADGETQREITVDGEKVKRAFKYHEPFYNHFKFRHQVDDHNNMRHSPLSYEESWSTKDWKHRVFAFIIALVEVNARLAHSYFNDSTTLSQIDFRRKLAKELIDYSSRQLLMGRNRRVVRDTRIPSRCGEETAPLHAGAWTGSEWEYRQTPYPQYQCKTFNCRKRVRTYCRCNKGHWLCSVCIGIHIASNDNDDQSRS
jgi:hypothetical protein